MQIKIQFNSTYQIGYNGTRWGDPLDNKLKSESRLHDRMVFDMTPLHAITFLVYIDLQVWLTIDTFCRERKLDNAKRCWARSTHCSCSTLSRTVVRYYRVGSWAHSYKLDHRAIENCSPGTQSPAIHWQRHCNHSVAGHNLWRSEEMYNIWSWLNGTLYTPLAFLSCCTT